MNTYKIISKSLFVKLVAQLVGVAEKLHGYLIVFFWVFFVKKIGKGVILGGNFGAGHPERLIIGDHSYIGPNSRIFADSGVLIGKYVMIANNCQIYSSNHKYSNYKIPIMSQGMKIHNKPVIIENDVWVGSNAIILPEVKLGRGSIVGAGSVVTTDVKPFSIVAGVPAKFIKFRFSKENIDKARQINF